MKRQLQKAYRMATYTFGYRANPRGEPHPEKRANAQTVRGDRSPQEVALRAFTRWVFQPPYLVWLPSP